MVVFVVLLMEAPRVRRLSALHHLAKGKPDFDPDPDFDFDFDLERGSGG